MELEMKWHKEAKSFEMTITSENITDKNIREIITEMSQYALGDCGDGHFVILSEEH